MSSSSATTTRSSPAPSGGLLRRSFGLCQLAYPFGVLVLVRMGLAPVAAALAFLGIASQLDFRRRRRLAVQLAGLGVLALGVAAHRPENLVRLYPLLVSLSFLSVFLRSLSEDVSAIERYARVVTRHPSVREIAYFRALTRLWTVFLAANSGVLFAFLFGFPLEYWAWYSGAVSYVLIGALIMASVVGGKILLRDRPGDVTSSRN